MGMVRILETSKLFYKFFVRLSELLGDQYLLVLLYSI